MNNFPKLEDLNFKAINNKYIQKRYPEFHKYLMSNYPEDLEFKERIYWYYHNLTEYPICKICGKRTSLRSTTYGYQEFCCQKCSSKDPERVVKSKKTCLEKYGDENYNNRKKCEETCLEKYGVTNPFAAESVKETIKNTLLEKYGVEYAQQSKEIQQTREENSLKKYGVKHHMHNPEIRQRVKKGLQKYSIDISEDLIGYTDNGDRIMKCPYSDCNKCDEKFYIIEGVNYFARKEFNIEPCTRLLPIKASHNTGTTIEIFIRNVLDDNNIEYTTNNRTILNGKEIDIYIPSKKIAIECNGVFWHSVQNGKSSTFHIDKYKQCRDQGIQLITVWADQINNTPGIVKSIILSKLGIYKERLYARKCHVSDINTKKCIDFLNDNHIQGRTNSNIKLGLFNNERLVGVMTFSKRSKLSGSKNSSDGEWELSRFCTLKNIQVVGGADKLLKYFIRNYNPMKIISFASNDISNGNLYKSLGFQTDNKITSAYWYIHKKTFIRYHRTSFTKSRLKDMGYNVDSKSESEIMKDLPYYKIYDSGHVKYSMEL